jgi:uncharacterized SAM-binding protein YcdF (DUF218 family)
MRRDFPAMNQIWQQSLIWLHKWGWLAAIIATLALLPIVSLYVKVSQFDHVDPDGQQRQAAIILGAALWDGKPSPALTERLNMGLRLYKEHKVNHLILSGGLEKWDGISEAEAMKRYLTAHGVPADRLILENRSTDTRENLLYTAAILKKTGWTKLYLVTHDYHMTRALEYARQAGLTVSPAPVHSEVLFTPYHKMRECLGLIKQRVFKR